jgi:hypothetical protein
MVLLTLSACASGVSKSYEFSQVSEKGLAIMGFSAPWNKSVTLTISELRDDGRLIGFSGETVRHNRGEEGKEFYVLELSPGTYVFRQSSWSNANTTYINCLSSGTYKFEIEAGVIKYVGDMEFVSRGSLYGRVKFKGMSSDLDVEKALSEYTNIDADFVRAKLKPEKFPRGRDAFGLTEVCGGYYQEIPSKSDGDSIDDKS